MIQDPEQRQSQKWAVLCCQGSLQWHPKEQTNLKEDPLISIGTACMSRAAFCTSPQTASSPISNLLSKNQNKLRIKINQSNQIKPPRHKACPNPWLAEVWFPCSLPGTFCWSQISHGKHPVHWRNFPLGIVEHIAFPTPVMVDGSWNVCCGRTVLESSSSDWI